MKNYKIYTIAFLILGFTACSPIPNKVVNNKVPNCAADGPGCEQMNPNKDSIRPCTREYKPVCGEVQIECVTTPCEPIKQTFPNSCVLKNNKRAKFLYNGACK